MSDDRKRPSLPTTVSGDTMLASPNDTFDLVALIDRGAAQRGGRSLDSVEREVSGRERKAKGRAKRRAA